MKQLIFSILICMCLSGAQAQGEASYRKLIDEQLVPKEVRMSFRKTYPNINFSLWYSSHIIYWYQDYAPGWYGNWYPTREVLVYKLEKPAYFEVDFLYQGSATRAIFSRYGQWFESRSKIAALPLLVEKKLRESAYGSWMWSDHKEKIIIPDYEGEIYRLRVYDRTNSYIIRMNERGEIIQIKYDE